DEPERQAEERDRRGWRLDLAGGERVEERGHDEQRRNEVAEEAERGGNSSEIVAGEREKQRNEQPARPVREQRLDGVGVGVGRRDGGALRVGRGVRVGGGGVGAGEETEDQSEREESEPDPAGPDHDELSPAIWHASQQRNRAREGQCEQERRQLQQAVATA